MVEININFQMNASEEERSKLFIDREAELEFMSEAFADGSFSVKTEYGVYSRYADPDIMHIVIWLRDIGETIIVWGTILLGLKKFCEKQKGYKSNVMIIKEDTKEEIIEEIIEEGKTIKRVQKKERRISIELEKDNKELEKEIKKFIEEE